MSRTGSVAATTHRATHSTSHHHRTSCPYMDDLLSSAHRDDLPALAQAAVVHAQFESIHPFTDGNGRVGRASINATLRRRRVTSRVVVPLAAAPVARREHYFALLDSYRAGDLTTVVSSFASASRITAAESRVTATRLADIPSGRRCWAGCAPVVPLPDCSPSCLLGPCCRRRTPVLPWAGRSGVSTRRSSDPRRRCAASAHRPQAESGLGCIPGPG